MRRQLGVAPSGHAGHRVARPAASHWRAFATGLYR
jgi:hypothetical protein